MGNGIYGENQGDENRAAGRHNGTAMMEERIEENALVEGEVVQGPYRVGVKLYTIGWKGMFQTGQWDTFNTAVEEVRQQWYSEFLMPPLEEGEEAEKYVKRVIRAETTYRQLVEGRIASMITSATVGECAFIRAQGTSLREGWKLTPKRGRE